ncbi:MAG: hypothetical protein AAGF93_08235 [Cyanobacteria bacterium P01_H01_bin.105]
MSSVLPIDTQRYQSGDYTLEVTAHSSPLSQWSDRPVVRQLRFSLWSEQLDRKRLAEGDQHQLMTLSDAVETYVQTHLNQQTWPQTHGIQLLAKTVTLSTLQLFDLAEVLNAYGQHQITLPVATPQRRQRQSRRQTWWTGSAVASLLVAVGVTTAYMHYRPATFNEVVTTQAPEATFEDDAAIAPSAQLPTASSAPAESASDELADNGESADDLEGSGIDAPNPNLEQRQELEQQPLDAEVSRTARAPAETPQPEAEFETVAPSADIAEASEPLPTDGFKLDAAPPPAAPDENEGPAVATTQAPRPSDLELQDSLEMRSRISNEATVPDMGSLLAAIAAQLAPYQPTDTAFPLVYHGQIAADGTILALEPVSEQAPTIEIPENIKISPPPERLIQIEITYTGAERPIVRER